MDRKEFVKIFDLKDLADSSWDVTSELKNDETTKGPMMSMLRKVLAEENGSLDAGGNFEWQSFGSQFQEDFIIFSGFKHRYGDIQISSWHTTGVKISYSAPDNIVVQLLVEYLFNILLRSADRALCKFREPKWSRSVGVLKYPCWSKKTMQIPIPLVWSWINGKLQPQGDPGITLLANDDLFLKYNTGQYPVALRRFFQSMGAEALHWLKENDFMSEEAYKMIEDTLQAPEGPYLERDPEPAEKPLFPAEDVIEAVQISKIDREYLRKIDDLIRVDPKLAWSYSQWGEGMECSKTTAYDVLKRLQEQGLVVLTPVIGGGVLVQLTVRARRVLSAFG